MQMYDSPNPEDASELDAVRDSLITLRWAELQGTGQTTFESDEETRTISRDEVMSEVLGEWDMDNLYYDITVIPLTFSMRVQEAFKVKIDALMEEAIEDFYDEL